MPFPLRQGPRQSVGRRKFIKFAGIVGGGAVLAACNRKSGDHSEAASSSPPAETVAVPAQREMARFPEKTDLILLTDRPPQLETPIKYFQIDLTPNEAFFVRWHLAGIPFSVDTKTFRLAVHGQVNSELSLSLDDLKSQFEPVSIVAVNQCSGNSRSLFDPRVPGGQWGNGAVGNAKWTGVRLADLLQKAGVKDGAVDVSFQGLDRPVLPQTPAFVKSLSYKKAMEPEVLVAYAMNDQPLPMLNGFPIRLVVPGWFATYWVKSLNDITVLADPFTGFWMAKAYRIANNEHASESPTKLATDTVPINSMTVRSLIVFPEAGEHISFGQPYEIQGVAIDSGKGMNKVEVSVDGGGNWTEAKLDPEIGKYSWRRFRYRWTPAGPGTVRIMARATNAAGQTQETSQWNRSGYARDVIEHVDVNVA